MFIIMEDYKIETIFAALLGGVGILWHHLLKQVSIYREDQKDFSNTLKGAITVIAESNELTRERNILDREIKEIMTSLKDIIINEQRK